jgi:hypothetical protein
MTKTILAWLSLFLVAHCSGCVGSFNAIPGDTSPAHTSACLSLDSKHRVGGTIAAASIAAATALAGAAALEAKDHPSTALIFSLSGAGAGVIGGGATYYTQDVFSTYQNLCTGTSKQVTK